MQKCGMSYTRTCMAQKNSVLTSNVKLRIMKYLADKFLWGNKMKIISFENKYRDDLIFMILEAKKMLFGRVPGFNEDLLDIHKNYF